MEDITIENPIPNLEEVAVDDYILDSLPFLKNERRGALLEVLSKV